MWPDYALFPQLPLYLPILAYCQLVALYWQSTGAADTDPGYCFVETHPFGPPYPPLHSLKCPCASHSNGHVFNRTNHTPSTLSANYYFIKMDNLLLLLLLRLNRLHAPPPISASVLLQDYLFFDSCPMLFSWLSIISPNEWMLHGNFDQLYKTTIVCCCYRGVLVPCHLKLFRVCVCVSVL